MPCNLEQSAIKKLPAFLGGSSAAAAAFAEWFESSCTVSSGAQATASSLFGSYLEWFKANRPKSFPASSRAFFQSIGYLADVRRRVSKGSIYVGIKLDAAPPMATVPDGELLSELVPQWVEERCIRGQLARVQARDALRDFRAWLPADVVPPSPKMFCGLLLETCEPIDRARSMRGNVYRGIALK